jgi:hypothetical protein
MIGALNAVRAYYSENTLDCVQINDTSMTFNFGGLKAELYGDGRAAYEAIQSALAAL